MNAKPLLQLFFLKIDGKVERQVNKIVLVAELHVYLVSQQFESVLVRNVFNHDRRPLVQTVKNLVGVYRKIIVVTLLSERALTVLREKVRKEWFLAVIDNVYDVQIRFVDVLSRERHVSCFRLSAAKRLRVFVGCTSKQLLWNIVELSAYVVFQCSKFAVTN